MAAGRLTRGQKDRLMLKHVRWPTLSARMMQSIMQIEVELGGYPQLGRTAKRAGTGIDYAASKIFLGPRLPSGRYTDNVAEVFRSAPEVSAAKYLSTLLELLKYAKNRP